MNDYQRGTKDAWELARRIFSYDNDCYTSTELKEIFGTTEMDAIMRETYDEAKEKIDKWNSREQYKVGDIIESETMKAFVTKVDDRVVNCVKENGETGRFVIDDHYVGWKVTGHTNSIVYSGEIWI